MAFLNLNIYSESLKTQTQVYVIMPQKSNVGEIGVNNKSSEELKCKCLYLLHGLSDDNTIWLRRTSIERYAAEYGIAVIMPFANRSFYTDMHYGGNYYTYIAKELPRIIEEMLNVSSRREDKFIAGLSMGGYGALKIGLSNPDSFSACAGLSSVADIKNSIDIFRKDFVCIFGEDINIKEEDDLLYLAKKCDRNPNKPRVFMGVGTDDFTYLQNQSLKNVFDSLTYDYTYRESKGTHCWAFWDEYIQYVLQWLSNK